MDDKRQNIVIETFNPARYWDYILGGHFNFEVDRAAGDLIIQVAPDARLGALANRAFLRRAVRYLAQHGIDQFIDLGSGIPTVGNVHEIAQRVNPEAHTVYVDKDSVAVTHSQSILKNDLKTTVVEENLLNFGQLIKRKEVSDLIDLKKPLGVLLISVLHFIGDDPQAYGLLKIIRSLLPPGSYVVISHFSLENAPRSTVEQLMGLGRSSSDPSKSRSLMETERFFDGFRLIDPGVVPVPSWQPESDDDLLVAEPERALSYCGVGLKE